MGTAPHAKQDFDTQQHNAKTPPTPMAHKIGRHLYQSELSEDAKQELGRIAARLPPANKWEDRGDGKVEAMKKEDVSEFQDDIIEIKKSCKVCSP